MLSNAGLSIPTGFTTADITFKCISSLEILGVKPDQISCHDFPVRRFTEVQQEILELLVSIERNFSSDFIFLLPRLTVIKITKS